MHNLPSPSSLADVTASSISPLPLNFKPTHPHPPHPRSSHTTDSSISPKTHARHSRNPSTPPQRKPRSPVCILPHSAFYLSADLSSLPSPSATTATPKLLPSSPVVSSSTASTPNTLQLPLPISLSLSPPTSSPTSPLSPLARALPAPSSNAKMAARGSHWSFAEKARFEAALIRHGPFAWRCIVNAVGTRSEKQVKAYAARYRRRKKMAARAELDALRDNMATAAQACAYAGSPVKVQPQQQSHSHPQLARPRPVLPVSSVAKAPPATSAISSVSDFSTGPVAPVKQDTHASLRKVEPHAPGKSDSPRLMPKDEPLIPQSGISLEHLGTCSFVAEALLQTQPHPQQVQQLLPGGSAVGVGVWPDSGEVDDCVLLSQAHVIVSDDLMTSSSSLSLQNDDDPFPTDPFSSF